MRTRGATLLRVLLVSALGACGPLRAPRPAVDVNNAPREALAKLPGLGPDAADRIIAPRPYLVKEDLRERRVLSDKEYEAVADRLAVGKPGMPDYLRSVPPQTP